MLGPGMSHSFPRWCFLHRLPGPKSMPCWIRWWWWAMCRSNQWDFGRMAWGWAKSGRFDRIQPFFLAKKIQKKTDQSPFWSVLLKGINICQAVVLSLLFSGEIIGTRYDMKHHETAVVLHLSLGPSMSSQACFKGKLSGDPNIWIWMVRTTLSVTYCSLKCILPFRRR